MQSEPPIRLTRILRREDGRWSAGHWMTRDGRFYLVRATRAPYHWILLGMDLSAWQWLTRNGLRDNAFPSRREALTRLTDALSLNECPPAA